MIDCPKCGKSCKNERGVNLHWGHMHDGVPPGNLHICDHCGDEFERSKKHLTDGNQFCNQECYGAFIEENYTGKNSPIYKERSVFTCDQCGDEFKSLPHARSQPHKFCNEECYGEWKEVEGNEHRYGSKWYDFKDEILPELPDVCCYPGCDRVKCKSGNELHLHHIIPVREFDSFSDANFVENLVPVCAEHHPTVEKSEQFASDFRND